MQNQSRPEDELTSHEERLYVVPLMSAVLFPEGILTLQMVEFAGDPQEGRDVVALFQAGGRQTPEVKHLSRIGVRAQLLQRIGMGGDRYQIVLRGRGRVRVERFLVTNDGHVDAVVSPAESPRIEAAEVEDRLLDNLQFLLEELGSRDARYGPDLLGMVRSSLAGGVSTVTDRLASRLHTSLEDKYSLLEVIDPLERIERLIALLRKDLQRASIDRDLERQTQLSVYRRDRDHYLREQLRVIQDELGDTPVENEVEGYVGRIGELPLDDDSKKMLCREVQRLGMLPPGSSDYSVVRGHLDTVMQVPWTSCTEDRLDLGLAEGLLERNHHGLKEVKERVLEFLSVVKLKGDLRGPILCFAGPSGVGKTSLGESIADALGRKFIRMSVGGMSDESEVRGHRKTYVGAMPGKLINGYIQAGVNNPLIMIDEIDKIGKDFRGDPASSLLEVLDPEQNTRFVDRYLEVPFDLSRTLFIVTGNVIDNIPSPLRDRLEVIRLPGYAENEKLQIARRHLAPKVFREHGLEEQDLVVDDEAMLTIIREYTAEAGVRELSRKLAAIARKTARRVVAAERYETRVVPSKLEDLLGLPVYEHEYAQRAPEIGLATGLAWTSTGGEIMFIEATRMSGTGRTTITGHLGEVMKESVRTAFSYVRSRGRDLEIDDDTFSSSDIHIHFPAGAIPKDGPSAGVAIATTIASLMADRAIRHDVAMTGELTLRGKVLSVGGVKEKVIAARRGRISKVILPMGNRKDLRDLPDEVKEGLEFVFAERVEDVWREALMPLYLVNSEKKKRKYDDAEFEADRARELRRES